jgi:hypothetical protein
MDRWDRSAWDMLETDFWWVFDRSRCVKRELQKVRLKSGVLKARPGPRACGSFAASPPASHSSLFAHSPPLLTADLPGNPGDRATPLRTSSRGYLAYPLVAAAAAAAAAATAAAAAVVVAAAAAVAVVVVAAALPPGRHRVAERKINGGRTSAAVVAGIIPRASQRQMIPLQVLQPR